MDTFAEDFSCLFSDHNIIFKERLLTRDHDFAPFTSKNTIDDALAVGNHELYVNEIAQSTYKVRRKDRLG